MAQLSHGMDIAQVQSSMGKIESYAGQIESLKGQLKNEVNNLLNIWSGQDANQFVTATWPPQEQSLTQLIEALRQLAQTGKQQAQQQEQASGN